MYFYYFCFKGISFFQLGICCGLNEVCLEESLFFFNPLTVEIVCASGTDERFRVVFSRSDRRGQSRKNPLRLHSLSDKAISTMHCQCCISSCDHTLCFY